MHPNFCLANWPIAFPQKSRTLRLQSTLFPAHQRHVQCTCNDHSMHRHTMIARCTSRNCSIYCLLRTLANRKPNMYIMWKNTLYTLIVHTHLSNWTQIFVVTEQLLPDDAILACVLQLKPMSLVGGILLFVIPSPCTRSTRCQLVCMHKAQTRGFAKESDKHPQSHYIRRSVLQMQILQKIIRLLPKPWAKTYMSGHDMNLTNVDKPLHQKVRPLDKIIAQTMSTNIDVRQTMLVDALSHWILLQSHY